MNASRGSIWRKWDLHVHTPSSIIQHYGSDDAETWEKFFLEIENLDNDFKVLGINDYLFIDGYRKVLEAKKQGRMANIELFLPVIELRLDKFGGSPGHLSRVNYHVIFSDEIAPDIIEEHFLKALPKSYKLTPGYEAVGKDWQALATRQSLIDLGNRIIKSVPPEERSKFGPSLVEGFNNLNFSLDAISSALQSHYFAGKVFTAVGKTEWADIKWTDHSIADKKTIINQAHAVFIASERPDQCQFAQQRLTSEGVNNRLFDCSDAHHFSDAADKDRLGRCFTWIKADPTFLGLCHAIGEYEERVFLGTKPPKVASVTENSNKYITSLKIQKADDARAHGDLWFDNELVFNHDLIAIIGGKGTGKSALTDIIALLANSHQKHFSFLTSEKFRKLPENLAKNFEARLTWQSGTQETKNLSEDVPENEVEKAKYIPQHFFDEICSEIARGNTTEFDRELKRVIFSHVDETKRLGQGTLDDLIEYRTREIKKDILAHRSDVHNINATINIVEQRVTEGYRQSIDKKIGEFKIALQVHEANKPAKVLKPETDTATVQLIEDTQKKLEALEAQVGELKAKRAEKEQLKTSVDRVLHQIDRLQKHYNTFVRESLEELRGTGIELNTVVKLEVNTNPLIQLKEKNQKEIEKIDKELNSHHENSLAHTIEKTKGHRHELEKGLSATIQKYQQYLKEKKTWEDRQKEITGLKDKTDSLRYYEHQLRTLDDLPSQLAEHKKRRRRKLVHIYKCLRSMQGVYQELYKPVQDFIETHPLIREKYDLKFAVEIKQQGFVDRFFTMVSHGARGTFHGAIEGKQKLKNMIDACNFNNMRRTLRFADEVIECLNKDMRDEREVEGQVKDQLRKGYSPEDLYDFVFSLEYLQAEYRLQLSDRGLELLSPGERGILLLIFHLLVDKDDHPLIIDQPEENLDNESIYKLLVPCIKEAKHRRQLFLVTHSPNLAVVCDAEQIIRASIDKQHGNRVEYKSGSVENPDINPMIVDILEGTPPAFQNRRSKYHSID